MDAEEIKEFIKKAVRSITGLEYIGEPTTLDEAVEIVRDIVNDALAEVQN